MLKLGMGIPVHPHCIYSISLLLKVLKVHTTVCNNVAINKYSGCKTTFKLK